MLAIVVMPSTVLQCGLDGRVLSTVNAEDTVDTGDYAEVAYEVVTGQHVL